MATVWFSANGSPWYQATVPIAEYTRTCAAEREFGSAKGFIPRDSPVMDTDAIDEDGGTLIKIEHALLPTWYGIMEGRPEQGSEGWGFEATEIGILLKYNDVPAFAMGGPATAGQIVKRAFDALTDWQRAGIRPGSFVEGPPLIPDYETDGTQFASILTEMSDASGQEWEIVENTDGALDLNWIAPRGAMYEPVLTEGWDLANVRRLPDTSTLVRRVRAVNTDTGFVGEATAPELAGNRLAQTVTITSDQTTIQALETAAQMHLDRHSFKNVRYTFGVRGRWTRSAVDVTVPSNDAASLYDSARFDIDTFDGGGSTSSTTTIQVFSAPAWAIRPGDYLRAVCPSAGKVGTTILARVMRITFGDGYAAPVFECQEIMPVDAAQLAVRSYRGQRSLAHAQTVPRLLAQVAS